MIDSKLSTLILSVLTVPVLILSIACGGEDAGPSRAEVEEIVRAELAESPEPFTAEPGLTSADVEKAIHAAMADMPQPEAGLSKSEVEEIVKAAVAAIPQPDPGLTSAEAEQIARGVVASIPPKSAPADYTRYFVIGGPLSCRVSAVACRTPKRTAAAPRCRDSNVPNDV